MTCRIKHMLRQFRTDCSGVALVEFAIALPLLLLTIGIVIEGSRIATIHQATAAGVRDAARMIARVAPGNFCIESGVALPDYTTEATDIVVERAGAPGERVIPSGVNVTSINATLGCVDVDYSTDDVPMVFVVATIEINFPFAGAFEFFGNRLDPLTTVISDQSRVFGI